MRPGTGPAAQRGAVPPPCPRSGGCGPSLPATDWSSMSASRPSSALRFRRSPYHISLQRPFSLRRMEARCSTEMPSFWLSYVWFPGCLGSLYFAHIVYGIKRHTICYSTHMFAHSQWK